MKKQLVGLGVALLSAFNAGLYAQKATETSAVLEYRKYGEMLAKGDMAAAKSALIKAKEYVDQAAEHADTKESPKTLFHKGEIYTAFFSLSMMTADAELANVIGEKGFDEALLSYKKAFTTSDKYDSDIKESIMGKKFQMETATNMMYKANQFKEAMSIYDAQVMLSDVIGQVDTLSLFNAGICAEKAELPEEAAKRYMQCAKYGYKAPEIYALASVMMRKTGKKAEAKAIIQEGRKKYPNDKGMLNELVNISMDEGDAEAAEKSLQEAIAADPKNKQLYYVIGTIYMGMNKNDKAEEALNKAIEIDPKYADALYQLGAHQVGLASGKREEASRLKFGDPNYDKMIAESDAYYKKALIPLESYINDNPNDKDVLTILAQIHRALKNADKAKEYKAKADAIK